jgi:hypothetical protein
MEGLTSSISSEYPPPGRLTARKDRQKSAVSDSLREATPTEKIGSLHVHSLDGHHLILNGANLDWLA